MISKPSPTLRIWFVISPNFDGYFGTAHRTVANGERATRITPKRQSQRQTRTASHRRVTLTEWSAELVVATLDRSFSQSSRFSSSSSGADCFSYRISKNKKSPHRPDRMGAAH